MASADSTFKRAQAEVSKGDYPAAMRDLKTVLERQPDHAAARAELARVSFAMGDLEAAQKELDRALTAGADARGLRSLQIDILLARAHYEDALKTLDGDKFLPPAQRLTLIASAQTGLLRFTDAEQSAGEALKLAAGNAEALYQMARAQLGQNHDDQALKTLDTLLGAHRDFVGAWLMRGQLLVKQGHLQEGREALRSGLASIPPHTPVSAHELALRAGIAETSMALHDLSGAQAALKDLDKRSPGSVPAAYLRARLAMLNGDYHTASNDLHRALQAAPEFTAARVLLGRSLMMEGNLEQADAELSQVLAADRNNVEAQRVLAQVNLARNRPDDARRVLDQAAQSGSADAQLDWLMGSALLQLGNSEEGIAHLEKSVAAAPGDNSLRIELARAYVAAGRNSDAIALIEQLPRSARTARSDAVLLSATVAGKTRADAQSAIDKVLAAHSEDALLWIAAGAYKLSEGDAERARQYLDKGLALDPKNVDGHLGRAQLTLRAADVAGAERELQTVLQLDPKNERAFMALAGIAWSRGDRTGARQSLERAIAANPAAVESRLRLAQMAFADSDSPRAHALLDQALSVASNRADALNAVGELLLRAGLAREALDRFEEGAKAGSQAAVLNTANAQLALNRESDARETLEAAYSSTPRSMRAGMMLVQLDVRAGHTSEAQRRIEQMRQAGLPAIVASEMTGDVDMGARQYDAAFSAYSGAAAIHPSASLALKMYRARAAAGKPDAVESLEHWLAVEPNDRRVRLALADVLRTQRKTPEAIREYERLIEGPAPEAVALNNLAWLYQQTGDRRALATARRAYEVAPGTPEISDTYGWFLVESGDVAGGSALLEKAFAAQPNNPEISYHLAAARARAGDKNKAASMLQTLLQKPGAFESRDSAERLLQALNK